MPSLKEVRTRIASVNNTRQITSAMKMVSAAKLQKAQRAILNFRPYAAQMNEVINRLIADKQVLEKSPFAEERKIESVLIVVITSNRGLCGAFNTNVIKAANNLMKTKYQHLTCKSKVQLLTIGKRATQFFSKPGFRLMSSHDKIYQQFNYQNVVAICDEIMDGFLKKKYDSVEIIYNRFKNAAVNLLTIEQFLPIKPDLSIVSKKVELEKKKLEIKGGTSMPSGFSNDLKLVPPKEVQVHHAEKHEKSIFERAQIHKIDYIYEPTEEILIKELVPKALRIQLFKALLESHAAEHGARMTAMHQATDNATELLRMLSLMYNKVRQSSITKEIMEIVGGADALKG